MIDDRDIKPGEIPRSEDCPGCKEVAFIVVTYPDVVECLNCGTRWRFVMPLPNDQQPPRIR